MNPKQRKRKRVQAQNRALLALVPVPRESDGSAILRGVPAVDGTHRTGKRRRGQSVTKQTPKTDSRVIRFDAYDESGECVGVNVSMLSSRDVTSSSVHRSRLHEPFAVPATIQADERYAVRMNRVSHPALDRLDAIIAGSDAREMPAPKTPEPAPYVLRAPKVT